MFLLLSNTQQNLLLLIKNHNLDTILWISANKVFYIVLYLALKTTKIKQDFTLTLDTYNCDIMWRFTNFTGQGSPCSIICWEWENECEMAR